MFSLNSALRYQTGTATFIQLAVVVFLVVINNIISLIDTCTNGSECAFNAFFSLVFIFATAIWFFVLSAIGYAAEERRSRTIAYALIAGQLMTIGVAYGFMKHPGTWFGGVSAFIVILFAAWTILLAWRLVQAKGGRIVTKNRKHPQHRKRQRYLQSIDEIDTPKK